VRFLSPLFLAGLLAAAVPVLLHLFRRRADPIVPFSAVRFLRRAPVEQAKRRRIRDLVLLALRVAAVSLLALSFARPYLAASSAATGAPLTIVAVDTSYSVSTPSQVRRTRELARMAVDAAPAGAAVALVRFDTRADVSVAPTLDRGLVRAGIDAMGPGAGGTRYGALIAAASDLAGGRPARLVVISDLQQRGWAEHAAAALPSTLSLEVLDVGGAAGNLAIAAVGRSAAGAIATVRNDWPERRAARVTFAVDGREIGSRPVQVDAGGSLVAAVDATLPSTGVLRAALDDPGGYAADDERFAVLDPPTRPRVVIVTGDGPAAASSLYLEAALAAVDHDEFDVVRWSPRERGARPWEGSAAVVLLGTYGVDRASLDALVAGRDGSGLLVAAGPAIEPARLDGVLPMRAPVSSAPGLSMAPADVRHPAFRSFEGNAGWLATVRFTRVLPLVERPDVRVLARFSSGAPALVERDGARRVLVLASDLSNAWNDFALHPAFVPFVHDLVRYAVNADVVRREFQVGERPGADAPGVIDGGGRHIAVNADPAEADRTRMTPSAFQSAVPRAGSGPASPRRTAAAEREREQSLWRYGLFLMLAALVAESAVGRRV